MNKILSIVIPTYNMEKLLRKCLDSLILPKELMASLEVLIINDGSKDNSSQIAHQYNSKFPETFRVIDKENGNYGSCINRGLHEANGKYIKILDADDYFDTISFKEYVDFLKYADSDMIITNFSIVNSNYEECRVQKFNFPTMIVSDVDDYCCSNDFCRPLSMHAVTYKRSILLNMGYQQTTGVSYTDQEWMFLPLTKMKDFIYLPVNLYQYLVGRDGQTVSPIELRKQASVRIMLLEKRINFYNDLEDDVSSRKKMCLRTKLLDYIVDIYRGGIISGIYDLESLHIFDKKLYKSNKELYYSVLKHSKSKLLGINYVNSWRNNNVLMMSIINIFTRIFK